LSLLERAVASAESGSTALRLHTAENGNVLALSATGDTIASWTPPEPGSTDVQLGAIADVSGDESAELLVTWQFESCPMISVLTPELQVWKTFAPHELGLFGMKPDAGSFEIRRLAIQDLNRDGQLELIAGLAMPSAPAQGGVCCLDLHASRPLWHAPTELPVRSITFADLDGDGALEIVCETGPRASDPAESVAGLLALGSDGEQLWNWQPSDGSRISVSAADFDQDGSDELVVAVGLERSDSEPASSGPSRVLRLDTAGQTQRELELQRDWHSFTAARLSEHTAPVIIIADDSTTVSLLDGQLRTLAWMKIASGRDPRLKLRIVAVEDLDADAVKELVLIASPESPATVTEPTAREVASAVREYTSTLFVLDQQLAVRGSLELPDGNDACAIVTRDVDGDLRRELVWLSGDRLAVLKYGRR
jgi:hypothetical protein